MKSDIELVTFIIPNPKVIVDDEAVGDLYLRDSIATKDGKCIRSGEYIVQTWTYKVQEEKGNRNNVESHGITKGEHNWRSMSSSVLEGVKEGDKFTFIHEGVQYTSTAMQQGS